MKSFVYRIAEFAAEHGYAEFFVRAFHVLTGHKYALRPLRVEVRRNRR